MLPRADLLDRLQRPDVPADVRRWVTGLVLDAMTPSERRAERDRWLRAAGALVTGAPWSRARALHELAIELASALPVDPEPSTARGAIAMALLVTPGRVPSLKTIGRVMVTIA